MKKHFEVIAKCGHVGREKYYEGHFPVTAANAESAARKIKRAPRVKKDHEDAILSVTEIDEEAYSALQAEHDANPYFHCRSKREQNLYLDYIKNGIKPETELQLKHREKHSKYYKDKLKKAKLSKYRGLRNPYRYFKLNKNLEIDTDTYQSYNP